jgi:signal transduction histidine kinase
LTEEGFTVSTALGGDEALRIMRAEHPDLILLDMMMPFVSGEDVMKAMQSDPQLEDIAVILVTARASEDDRLFGLSLGADDYIAKPIHHEELMFRVKNILHRRELHYKVASLEEREKLAQLGQMMRDLSHELKNVFQRDLRGTKEEKQCGLSIIRRLPVSNPSWELAGLGWVEEKLLTASQVQTVDLTFPSKELSQSQALRYLRMSLAQLDINPAQRQELWKAILGLSPEEQIACDHAIHLVRSFLVLQDQVQYATELIINILDYSRTSNHNETCEISMVIPRVMKLIKPRLHRLGIQIDLDLKPWCLRIGSSQLMQITLNLLTNACDAIEEIPMENRFIRIVAQEIAGKPQLAFSNAGKPITAEQSAVLFKESWSSKGSKGYGLGLAISQRLAQRVSGQLTIDEQAAHPCFILTLEWSKTDAIQNVG